MYQIKRYFSHIKSKLFPIAFIASFFAPTLSFALNQVNLPNGSGGYGGGNIAAVWGQGGYAFTFFQYIQWASIVIAIGSLGIMLVYRTHESILKGCVRVLVVSGIIALAFSVPSWFGLNI